jgi:hypothetical protein
MEELKTLKDLEEELKEKYYDVPYSTELIRQEAIKWIKELDSKAVKLKLTMNGGDLNTGTNLAFTRGWIKMFFNITDEELK